MQFKCPHCNTLLKSDEVTEGQEVECPACGLEFACEEFRQSSKAAVETGPGASGTGEAKAPKAESPAPSAERSRCAPSGRKGVAGVRRVALLALPVVALLCLLGLGVRSCGSSGATARRIEQALAYDAETGDRLLFHAPVFDERAIENLGAVSSGEARYVAAMRSYLLAAKLPKDFKIAFLNHVSAHSELGHVADTLALEMRTTGAKPGSRRAWLETAKRLSEEFAQASHEIDSTFDIVLRLAIQHGANIPEKIANPRPNVP